MNDCPLADVWRRIRARLEEAPIPKPTGVSTATYLDAAERVVRAAAPWQDRFGAIIDPYLHYHTSTCTPRFVGALGQLIGAGRCRDLVDVCVRSYEYALANITEPRIAPEFAVKELVLAHRALRDKIEPERLAKWEAHWRDYRAESAYLVIRNERDGNFNTFGLVGEFARIREGLGGDPDLVDRLLEKELRHVDDNGMYQDPGCPLTYHVVVMQQLALLLALGYRGHHYDTVADAVRRGGLASLLMQSAVGQAPFGGRSNQFHHCEAQAAALFEVCARLARDDGDALLAGAFKRAARRGVALTLPWIMEMEPYRHLKQGFHPRLNHGTDSYGPYSVYGTLIASLLCIAVGVADESIEERLTPAECGGYVFTLTPEFHQVFAHCGGWSVQTDTKANRAKDATGLGRVHRIGLRPEAILAGSIPAEPGYVVSCNLPQRNVAIGPEWDGADGKTCPLADFSQEIEGAELVVLEQTADRVAFEIIYRGKMGEVREICEHYELSSAGLHYSAQIEPQPQQARITVPIIESDGDAISRIEAEDDEIRVTYRGGAFCVAVANGVLELTDERNTNRNATYRTALCTPSAADHAVLVIS